ncbi:MAG: IclR family transcriptional regulator [Chloroflexi bacterium]|nr:IclR family transcriptional regulator [Chloroflexota bacterium]
MEKGHWALPESSFKTSVPAVEQASRVLLCLAESSQSNMRLTDICDHLGISKSKGHAILNTLKQFELIDKDPKTKTYSLGPALIFLSQRVLENLSYPEVVTPFLENLVKETNGTAAFGLISELHVFVIAKRDGNQNIGFRLPIGHKFHITLGAHGKAIVAFMDEAERAKLLAKKKLYFYGDSSRMDLQRLAEDIAKCQSVGFALDQGDVTPAGITALSAPVFAIRKRMVGCVILLGPFDASKVQEYGSKTAQAAKQISRKLGAHVDAIFPT